MKDKILIVEDDDDLSFIMKTQLEEFGYIVKTAYNCKTAKEYMGKDEFDLMLVDMMLPDASGIELCREIRKSVYCPIIFVSCIGEQDTVISALREGADDYVIKPINFGELSARIEANLRRKRQYDGTKYHKADSGEKEIPCGCFRLCTHTHNLKADGKEDVSLSPIEYKLIMMFIEYENELLLYEELYRCIWESDDLGDVRTVMVHVSNLRKKLEKIYRDCIQTVRGAGYIFYSSKEEI